MDEDTQLMDQEMEDDYAEDEVQEVEIDEDAQEPEVVETKPAKKQGDYQKAMQAERARRKKLEEQNAKLQELIMERLATPKPQEPEVDPLDEVFGDLDDVDPRMVKALKAVAATAKQSGKSDDLVGVQVELLKDKYPGITDHKAEIATLVKRLGVTAEEAYLMKHGHELITRSREDVLREHDIKTAAHMSAPGISAAGNAQQTPPKKTAKVNISKRDADYLQSKGISLDKYAKIEARSGNGGMTLSQLQQMFGGAKKG